MSCNTCQSKFTFFARERGCPNCGFSYCGKCLKYNWKFSSNGSDKRRKICGPCHNRLTIMSSRNSSTGDDDSAVSPAEKSREPKLTPIEITNRLESLENPAKPPIIIYKAGNKGRWEHFKEGLEPADLIIAERLKKLKEPDGREARPTTTDEIRRRLDILKDVRSDESQRFADFHQTDARTDRQKEDDLIRRYLDNFELTRVNDDPAREIEARLNSLKSDDPRMVKNSSAHGENVSSDDDETAADKIIDKALAEAAIEAKYEMEEMKSSDTRKIEGETTRDENDDDVSCCMCEQTAGLFSCQGCTGDLYCEICFDDNHDESELPRHKKVSCKKLTRAETTND